MWWGPMYAAAGAFLGSMVGMLWTLKNVARRLRGMLNTDPDIDKIEITVVMNREI